MTQQRNKSQTINAKFGFETDQKMWKNNDYRCLKPNLNLKPEEWPHYDMKGYRKASTKEELENVKEIKYDKYFFNFEDPKIFKEMMVGNRRKHLWKKTFGYDFVYFHDTKNLYSMLPCHTYCLKAEHARFARKCKEKGGLFKCCLQK